MPYLTNIVSFTGRWQSIHHGLLALFFTFGLAQSSQAQVKRLVLVKVDGLSYEMIDHLVRKSDPRTGKSYLPWIDYLFYENGTRLENFYTRGISLSGPSWSLLNTGQHLQIKGNVEYDRYTFYGYDYLNFMPFFIGRLKGERVDMPGVEILDDLGIPLLADHFSYPEQFATLHTFQRGIHWTTFKRTFPNYAKSRSLGDIFSEWVIGMDMLKIVSEQLERELLEKLHNPDIKYLEYSDIEFDHAMHHVREPQIHLRVLQGIDATIGRLWSEIQKTALAKETVLLLVSDHGANTDEKIYSQGFNLVELLGTAEGGGHHVVTKRPLLRDYSLKSLNPFTAYFTASSLASGYLKGKENNYPTATLDLDGNERASLQLRNSDWNLLQILLQQLADKKLAPERRRAATRAFFETVEAHRAGWQQTITELEEELPAVRDASFQERAIFNAETRDWTRADTDAGRDKDVQRHLAKANLWATYAEGYEKYVQTLKALLALRRESFDPTKLKPETIIPPRSMGDLNTIYQLQNYIVGPSPQGLVLNANGELDAEKSFRRFNYLTLFASRRVRNNVQPGVASRPIDFVAARIPLAAIESSLSEDELPHEDAVWVYGSEEKQALILARRDSRGILLLRYLPVSRLLQEADGKIQFRRETWQAGFPLKIFEDQRLSIAAARRAAWLNNWHTEEEWLEATHQTAYSNAIIGLHEHFSRHPLPTLASSPELTASEKLQRRFRARQRRLVEADFLLLASDHWNFDVRGFNPGGNHGSFLRASTHSTLMFVGGQNAGIPVKKVIATPYDSLSFVPTVMALMSEKKSIDPAPALHKNGASVFPGRLIKELFQKPEPPVTAANP